MKRIYVLCEGHTEETFINEILAPYLSNVNIYITPIICTTKRTASKKHTGGVSEYNKIKIELTNLCKQHRNELVTTMFDYYAMPKNTPNIDCTEVDIYKRMTLIEKAIDEDIGEPNCFFNFMLHEFEGLLFSSPEAFAEIAEPAVVEQIKIMCAEVISPEHINNSPETAPSKRLEALIPGYAKVRNGALLSKNIGIDKMMEQCIHFAGWVQKLKFI